MADDDTPSSDEGSLCPQEDQNERNSAGGEDGLSDGEASRREEGTRQQETPEQETQDEEAFHLPTIKECMRMHCR